MKCVDRVQIFTKSRVFSCGCFVSCGHFILILLVHKRSWPLLTHTLFLLLLSFLSSNPSQGSCFPVCNHITTQPKDLCKKNRKEFKFQKIIILFTKASVHSRKPGPTLVPGVFIAIFRLLGWYYLKKMHFQCVDEW